MTEEKKKLLNELLKNVFKGNKEACGEFYEKFLNDIYSFVLYKVKIHEVAEDIVQDTFLKIIKKDFKKIIFTNPTAYAFEMAKNLCKDYFKKNERYEKYITNLIITRTNAVYYDFYSFEISDGFTHIEDELVILRYGWGYTVKEISQRIKISTRSLTRIYNTIKEKVLKNIA